MDQSFQPFFYFKKDSKVNDSCNTAFDFIADIILGYYFLAFFRRRFFFGENQLAFLWQGRDYCYLHFLADKFLELFLNFILVRIQNARIMLGLQLRGWQKSSNSLPLQNKSDLVGVFDLKLKYHFLLYRCFG